MKPILDTREYMFQYPDVEDYTVTHDKVVEYLYSKVDIEVNQLQIYWEIVVLWKGIKAAQNLNQLYDRNVHKYNKNTTGGWYLEMEWKYGSTYWIPLSVLKKNIALYVARNEVDNQIIDVHAFDWWSQGVLKRSKRLISKASKT